MSNKELETIFLKEIDKASFSILEMAGFRAQPRLALLAG